MPGLVDTGETVSFDLAASLMTSEGRDTGGQRSQRERFAKQGGALMKPHAWSASCLPADSVEFFKIRGSGPEHGESDNCCFFFPPHLSYTPSGSTATSSVLI